MQGDYGYGNARVRAMKSRLLDARAYGDLLAATSIDMVIEMLVRTAYRETIEATLVKYGGVKCVAEALRLDLARTVGRIKLFFEGRPRALVALLLSRWDMRNLMAVLRGQARGVPAEEILDALVPAGPVRSRVVLTRLAGGHVSDADRHWVRSLGFADLMPEFDAQDCEGQLRTTLDAVAATLSRVMTPPP